MKTRKSKIKKLFSNAEICMFGVGMITCALLFVQGCFKASLGECVIGGTGAIGFLFCVADEINNRLEKD